jgi:hypothetical protein
MIACAVVPSADANGTQDAPGGCCEFVSGSRCVSLHNGYALISGTHGAYYRISRAPRGMHIEVGTPDTPLAPASVL